VLLETVTVFVDISTETMFYKPEGALFGKLKLAKTEPQVP